MTPRRSHTSRGASAPFAAVLSAEEVVERTVDYVRFVPGTLVVSMAGPDVYLPQEDGRLLRVPAWSVTTDLGLGQSARTVAEPDLVGYSRPGDLTRFVSCDGVTS